METKQSARELLQEAREALADIYGEPSKMIGGDPCMLNLIAGIDSYLAAPSESALEMAMRIGKECSQWREDPDSPSGPGVYFDAVKAAALIEGYGRRVPRKMLEDVAEVEAWLIYYYGKYTKLTDNSMNSIAAKHGVVIEDREEASDADIT